MRLQSPLRGVVRIRYRLSQQVSRREVTWFLNAFVFQRGQAEVTMATGAPADLPFSAAEQGRLLRTLLARTKDQIR